MRLGKVQCVGAGVGTTTILYVWCAQGHLGKRIWPRKVKTDWVNKEIAHSSDTEIQVATVILFDEKINFLPTIPANNGGVGIHRTVQRCTGC